MVFRGSSLGGRRKALERKDRSCGYGCVDKALFWPFRSVSIRCLSYRNQLGSKSIRKTEKAEETGGVVHCFSYTKETARAFLDMGFFFGIGGVLTFKNARKLREVVEYIALDRIVLETDCLYLAPVPYRGQRNSSLYLPYVVSALAQAKGIGEEAVRRAVWENSVRLYRMEGR